MQDFYQQLWTLWIAPNLSEPIKARIYQELHCMLEIDRILYMICHSIMHRFSVQITGLDVHVRVMTDSWKKMAQKHDGCCASQMLSKGASSAWFRACLNKMCSNRKR